MTGCSPRVKQKTLSFAFTATPATSTKRQPSGSLPQPSMTWKVKPAFAASRVSPAAPRPRVDSTFIPETPRSPVHALEATAQGLAGLFMGDHVEPVRLHRA